MLFILLSWFSGRVDSFCTGEVVEVSGVLVSSSCSLPSLFGRDLGSGMIQYLCTSYVVLYSVFSSSIKTLLLSYK